MAWITNNQQIISVLRSMKGKTIGDIKPSSGNYPDLVDSVKIQFTDGTSVQINAGGASDNVHLQAEHLVEYPDPE